MLGSMCAPANHYEIARVESFTKTLKVEDVYLAGHESLVDVAAGLPRFIDDVYKAKHMNSSIGYQPPQEWRPLPQ